LIATLLAGCVSFKAEPPKPNVILPQMPYDLQVCFDKSFPEIPDRVNTTRDVVRVIGRAKVLDRVKSQCGLRAHDWIEEVIAKYGAQSAD